MTPGLHIENMHKGMKLLIRRGPRLPSYPNPWGQETQTRYDKQMEGVVFKVEGISPPFIAVRPYAGPGHLFEDELQIGHLDTREYQLVLADPSYVKALRENVKPTEPEPVFEPPVRYISPEGFPIRQVNRNGIWVWERCGP